MLGRMTDATFAHWARIVYAVLLVALIVSIFIRWRRGGRAGVQAYFTRMASPESYRNFSMRNVLLWAIVGVVIFIVFNILKPK